MAAYISKIEVLLKISELKEIGKIDEAMRLQKVFLDSIKTDRNTRKFSSQIELDRKSKKTIIRMGLALTIAST